jgi:hypothetical protein
MAGHNKQACRPVRASVKKKARYIGSETWELFKDDVYKRYIVEDQPLEKIMQDFELQCNFSASYGSCSWMDSC